MESSFCAKKKDTVPGLDLKNFKCAPAHFFISGVRFADVMLDMLHIFKLISAPPCTVLKSPYRLKLILNRMVWDLRLPRAGRRRRTFRVLRSLVNKDTV